MGPFNPFYSKKQQAKILSMDRFKVVFDNFHYDIECDNNFQNDI
jgi:predicted xylose isomerase-like sugar epimerase